MWAQLRLALTAPAGARSRRIQDRALSCCSTCSGSCRSARCRAGEARDQTVIASQVCAGSWGWGRIADVLVTGRLCRQSSRVGGAPYPDQGFLSRRRHARVDVLHHRASGHARWIRSPLAAQPHQLLKACSDARRVSSRSTTSVARTSVTMRSSQRPKDLHGWMATDRGRASGR